METTPRVCVLPFAHLGNVPPGNEDACSSLPPYLQTLVLGNVVASEQAPAARRDAALLDVDSRRLRKVDDLSLRVRRWRWRSCVWSVVGAGAGG